MDNLNSKLFCGTLDIKDVDEIGSNKNIQNIHLYKIELSKYETVSNLLYNLLTPLEAQRAQRYRQLKDRNRFIICRSLLKYLIARKTGHAISNIQFVTNNHHKPYFPLDPSLYFNVSHSGNYAVIAIGNCELGIDIEYMDTGFDFTEILPKVFNEMDVEFILNSNNKNQTFYNYWTRKEAIVKAIGKGMNDNLNKIPSTDGLHALSSSLLDEFKIINVYSFRINPDYIGALAITQDLEDMEEIKFHSVPCPEELTTLFNDIYLS